jgi:hypothetical protein
VTAFVAGVGVFAATRSRGVSRWTTTGPSPWVRPRSMDPSGIGESREPVRRSQRGCSAGSGALKCRRCSSASWARYRILFRAAFATAPTSATSITRIRRFLMVALQIVSQVDSAQNLCASIPLAANEPNAARPTMIMPTTRFHTIATTMPAISSAPPRPRQMRGAPICLESKLRRRASSVAVGDEPGR